MVCWWTDLKKNCQTPFICCISCFRILEVMPTSSNVETMIVIGTYNRLFEQWEERCLLDCSKQHIKGRILGGTFIWIGDIPKTTRISIQDVCVKTAVNEKGMGELIIARGFPKWTCITHHQRSAKLGWNHTKPSCQTVFNELGKTIGKQSRRRAEISVQLYALLAYKLLVIK